jgi:hypothetical protein
MENPDYIITAIVNPAHSKVGHICNLERYFRYKDGDSDRPQATHSPFS